MKNISLSILPNFHGLRNEYLETFIFEFGVLCRSYDYLLDPQKFKLFPATLKNGAFKLFMGLGTHTIRTWEEMKNVFLEKYKDYYMPHNLKDEFFKMMPKEDEILEYLVKIFSYNVKRTRMHDLDDETFKALFF